MTEADKAELTALLARVQRPGSVPHGFLAALLLAGGTGVFLFLYACTEILPWHS